MPNKPPRSFMPTIYHGTPMTPRAALVDVCAGRAMCVSFYRPDDVEAVEAISPAIMFRQRRIFILEGSNAQRTGVGRDAAGLDAIFRVAGAALVSPWPMGGDPRHSGCAQPAQRRTAQRLALWSEGRAALAHGRADRTATQAVRQVRPGLSGLDWRGQVARHAGVSRPHGGGVGSARQSLASDPYDARDAGSIRLSVHQRRQHFTGAERMAL